MNIIPNPQHDLLQRSRDGDVEAFSLIAETISAPLYSVCLAILKNPGDAEDAAQEILIKIFTSIADFKLESQFSTWVYRIAYNHCLDMMRRHKIRQADSLDEMMEEQGDYAAPRDPGGQNPYNQLADRMMVEKAMEALSPDQRMIIILREVSGLSYEEIAESSNLSVGTVKSRLFRARDILREEIERLMSDAKT